MGLRLLSSALAHTRNAFKSRTRPRMTFAMSMPRGTIRQLLIVVAIVGLALGAGDAIRRRMALREHYRQKATECSVQEQSEAAWERMYSAKIETCKVRIAYYSGEAENFVTSALKQRMKLKIQEETKNLKDYQVKAEIHRNQALHYGRSSREYEHAASRFW